jgi:hypothetical protein
VCKSRTSLSVRNFSFPTGKCDFPAGKCDRNLQPKDLEL